MKKFNELTPEQQEKVLDNVIAGPLFCSFKDALRELFSSSVYMFDDKLVIHILPQPMES